jgi:hypothetical protein
VSPAARDPGEAIAHLSHYPSTKQPFQGRFTILEPLARHLMEVEIWGSATVYIFVLINKTFLEVIV